MTILLHWESKLSGKNHQEGKSLPRGERNYVPLAGATKQEKVSRAEAEQKTTTRWCKVQTEGDTGHLIFTRKEPSLRSGTVNDNYTNPNHHVIILKIVQLRLILPQNTQKFCDEFEEVTK